mgnify:CR=1 FL=1
MTTCTPRLPILTTPLNPSIVTSSLTAEEDSPGAAPVIILGYAVWKNHYSGDPEVIGKTASINGQIGTVIGVMPKSFQFPGQDGGLAEVFHGGLGTQ